MKDLLLLLCRYPFEEKNREALTKLLNEVQDWNKLVELINAHGIIALAAYNIKEAGLDKEIPGYAMAVLENSYLKNVIRNTWLTERWKEVNAILSNAGIKHVLLKGMALEHTLYGSRGLRQMNDNDILTKRDDALRAWTLLKQNGFSQELMKSPLHKKVMLDIGKHLPCLYKNGYAIEIHHKLFDKNVSPYKSYDDLIDNAVEISVSGTKALILPKEMQIMHLIDHFERHALEGDSQIRMYADIILLDKTSSIVIKNIFMGDPMQSHKTEYHRSAYKITLRSMPVRYRLRFLIGDIFPAVQWMKKRYRCSGIMAILFYPHRLGKLVWLV